MVEAPKGFLHVLRDMLFREKTDKRHDHKTCEHGKYTGVQRVGENKTEEATFDGEDLHADEKLVEGNIMTEYEEKFSAMGNPICKYVIYR